MFDIYTTETYVGILKVYHILYTQNTKLIILCFIKSVHFNLDHAF